MKCTLRLAGDWISASAESHYCLPWFHFRTRRLRAGWMVHKTDVNFKPFFRSFFCAFTWGRVSDTKIGGRNQSRNTVGVKRYWIRRQPLVDISFGEDALRMNKTIPKITRAAVDAAALTVHWRNCVHCVDLMIPMEYCAVTWFREKPSVYALFVIILIFDNQLTLTHYHYRIFKQTSTLRILTLKKFVFKKLNLSHF